MSATNKKNTTHAGEEKLPTPVDDCQCHYRIDQNPHLASRTRLQP